MSRFEIDSDIRKARTLPSEFYTDPVWYHRSLEAVFARSWQFVSRIDSLNSTTPHNLMEGSLNEPVVLTRHGGRVRVLSNVCTHRGNILVDQPQDFDLIQCGYHGRKFARDGSIVSMPEFEQVECFPGPEDDLHEYASADWNGFVFAGIDPISKVEALFGPLDNASEGFVYESLKLASTRSYKVSAHWALYCENYLEGFHIPYVHPDLNRLLDFSSYSTDLFEWSSLQTGRARTNHGSTYTPPFTDGIEALYYFVFPNTMLNLYPWGLSINQVLPLSEAETEVRYFTFVSDGALVNKGAGGDLDTVELEDQRVVESVQKGIRSRFYDRGRYSPLKETGTHHFHRLIASCLGEFE
ncbi:MAG: aromatic ring-hydroxylating dioxygenase subunit alpha [Acidobacteria bacterium]|nr:MAG: aromatic ring-hydroxylating dioxygenase subunit alpha [Acidobacteriota bacterium]REK02405.1 MAG: aromatic ring-hydroxylating dioxygenase subunit alpha [Acidobacteriota bacterium]REK13793.1 MAG: aromatic ring-hydroxylating dioxygenase subunit alpha [Acidobacteriota bacterium]REK41787.1 MAG: aromatic ring-hydroxylating dioxygenase subunit alpha [Acidobacteriota bacterium]